ncbi:GPI transamidase component Gpi16, putative [Talaromyces stipitatus ATCC 10500]|uniref:GPI transamidase component Gpi16, putative n=1 Tax=Talaromyces stipitatus (strain ATCC 10500 / CBS 375.48 / QM 6759 / NRRL 1006) TaxID=441959 RepID=B8LYQ1_TALSN|nr:GPI transamidase component Gpi16, putative [Talaromyces stipitatus ATCC 10500]EED23409.1 GPI transamidase component Gpi16, putative [Talaromyces stipitatus ATCC 10500]
MKSPFLSLAALTAFLVTCLAGTDYHERLTLQPLPTSSLLASFNFRSNSSISGFENQHFRYFPRSLGQILQHTRTKELHVRFTTGRWDDESWGARPSDGYKEGATGVELWAWIDSESQEEAFAHWISLTQSLSGLFCASMNFIDSTRTTSPVVSFEPLGDHPTSDQLYLLHGTLPGEVVCTENLTPFLKMLPCKGKAGISSLFDGHKLFDASWQSMSIDIRPICPAEGGECLIEIEQGVDMVLDIDRSKRPRDNPIPRPVPTEELVCDPTKPYNSDDTCFPLEKKSEVGWTLSEIFGRTIKGHCPLTDEAGPGAQTVCLKVPDSRTVLTTPGATEIKDGSGISRCFVLSSTTDFDLVLPEEEAKAKVPLQQGVLHAERTIIGHGQERGGLRVIFRNPSTVKSVDFIYFESLPWFMRPYLHTLQATVVGNDGISRQLPFSDIIKGIYYRPAIDREKGTQLELVLSVPADSTVTLIYDIEKAILRYTEYPPDANRGFNVAPAVIRILDQKSRSPVYLRTTGLLLSLPTPDFSMPYNVIILTSTVMALGFGSIFNLLVRRFVPADEPALRALSLKARLASRLVTIRDRLSGKLSKVKEK